MHTIFLFSNFASNNAGIVDCVDGTDEHECDNTHEGSSTIYFSRLIKSSIQMEKINFNAENIKANTWKKCS